MYSLILFDMDGTLFDFKKAEKEAFDKTFNNFGTPEISKQHSIFNEINLKLWKKLEEGKISPEKLRIQRFKEFFIAIGVKLNPKTVSEKYISFLREGYHLIPHSKEILRQLKKDKKEVAIITNGLSDVQHKRLKKSGILPCINGVYISEEIGFAKPDPRYFFHVVKQFKKYKKNRILIVGDSLSSDIKGANICGLDSVWFNPENKKNNSDAKPSYEIKDLKELLKIIK